DTAVACNEESDDPGTTPGRAAVLSTFLLLATYAVVTVAAIAFAGTGSEGIGLGNPDNSGDVFASIGPALFGDSVLGHKTFTSSVRNFFMRFLVPLLGGVILLVIFVYGLLQYAKPDWLTDDDGNNVTILGIGAVAVVGIGALILGLVLMAVWRLMAPGFFKGITLPKRADLLLEPATASTARFGLPDSGDMPTVIAADLSNLPAGETAVNPTTGEEFTKGG
ncbi:MAG TPA: amino acid transporter, partial [Mycobacterium sp.]|nr:amino acid transporter [Mycobacterium sp.]